MSPELKHKAIRNGKLLFMQRIMIVPFETATAFLAVWTGIASFFDYGVTNLTFSAVLPIALVTVFNLLYILSGSFIIAGIGWGHRNIEATGLTLLFTSFVIRLIAITARLGVTPITMTVIIQALTFGAACLIRLFGVLRNEIIVRAEDLPSIVEAAQAKGRIE